jgi:hypothetical protein
MITADHVVSLWNPNSGSHGRTHEILLLLLLLLMLLNVTRPFYRICTFRQTTFMVARRAGVIHDIGNGIGNSYWQQSRDGIKDEKLQQSAIQERQE